YRRACRGSAERVAQAVEADVERLVRHPRAVEDGVEGGRPEELAARVAEVATDRVLAVEGLDGIAEASAGRCVSGGGLGGECGLGPSVQRAEAREGGAGCHRKRCPAAD